MKFDYDKYFYFAVTMSHGNPISELIVIFTKDSHKISSFPISHSISILGDLNGKQIAMSADDILSNLVNVDRYRNNPKKSMRLYAVPIPEGFNKENRTDAVIKRQNQKIYPHLELIWFVYRWIRRKINPKWQGKNWFSYSYFCSEGVGYDFKNNGFESFYKNIDLNTFDATELENLQLTIPGMKLVELWEKGVQIEITTEVLKKIFG